MKRLGRMLQLLPNEQRVVIALVAIIVGLAAWAKHRESASAPNSSARLPAATATPSSKKSE
jgi:hypothetical protein